MTVEPGFYDFDGNSISVQEFARLWEGDRRLVEDDLDGGKVLKTMWLGLVDPAVCARLYGTALVTDGQPKELQTYDSKAEALAGHGAHLAAIAEGFHCHVCQKGERHHV